MTTGRLPGQGGLRQRTALPGQQQQQQQQQTQNQRPGQPGAPVPVSDPKSPFTADTQNPATPAAAFAYSPPTPQASSWFDRVVDAIVGEEGPASKYALICQRCHTHNGLVLPEELEDIQYFCPKCNHFNASRRKRRSRASTMQNEPAHGSLADSPSPASSQNQDRLMVPGPESSGRIRHAHRTSLPDLRVADVTDTIEGARGRVERDAISEVGADTDDERLHGAAEDHDAQDMPDSRPITPVSARDRGLGDEEFTQVDASEHSDVAEPSI
ncbi:hypothetical protein THASP1DRAFT_33632 [Thamnocephalis sphaerospora]|uniref:Endoplasmic reticulum junction formation protein lunapark n=1 Tax=Thamnocephalis sphaerospora TaxID=78915 RepID=A0A4P9XG47_9FUNG|nr:hypothetical protein THASP1DRAFT_33632 [Thamnocephalis sphaerospora]|eukprot:RKP04584.1 hypothetical protein THASP1DRAFT_33632 [Thamnocephalis sphaerospora]